MSLIRIITTCLMTLTLLAPSMVNAQPRPRFDEKKQKWGYVDEAGEWTIKPKYETANPFIESPAQPGEYRALVQNKEKWALIDPRGKNLSGNHESIEPDSCRLLIISDKERYGVIDYNGKTVLKNDMDRVVALKMGGGVFKKNELWGYFNPDGVITVVPEHEALFEAGYKMLKVRKGLSFGLIDANGNILLPSIFNNLEAITPELVLVKEHAGIGLLTTRGTPVIESGRYDAINIGPESYFTVDKGHLKGLVNASGIEVVTPGDYSSIELGPGSFFTLRNSSNMGYADSNGRTFIPPLFSSIEHTPDGLYIAKNAEGLTMFDTRGHEIIGACESIGERKDVRKYGSDETEKMFECHKGGKVGLLNLRGGGIECNFDSIGSIIDSKGIVELRQEGVNLLMTTGGEIYADMITPIPGSSLRRFSIEEDLYGLMDSTYNKIVPPVYSTIEFPDSTAFMYGLNDTATVVWDNAGVELWHENTPLLFHDFSASPNTIVYTNSTSPLYGVIDRRGQLLVPVRYTTYNEIKARFKEAGITDIGAQRYIKDAIDYVDALALTAITPAAFVNEITVDHNVYYNGSKGMRIHVNFDINNAYNHDISVVAYFYHDDSKSRKVMDRDRRYKTTDGQVSTSERGCPRYESSNYSDFTLFLPYSQLHLSRSAERYNLKFCIGIHDHTWKKQIGTSDYVSFTYSNPL